MQRSPFLFATIGYSYILLEKSMSYVDDEFLAILGNVENTAKEAEKEIAAAGEMSEDVISNLHNIFEQGEDIGIDVEDLKTIMEARSTVHIKQELIERIFRNFKPEFWMKSSVTIDVAIDVLNNAQSIQDEYF
jgi:hypothetical protein